MLRIENKTGMGLATKLTDLETGVALHHLPRSIAIKIPSGGKISAEFAPSLIGIESGDLREIDLTTRKAEWMAYNPATKMIEPLAAIVFRDGTQIDFLMDGGTALKPGGRSR